MTNQLREVVADALLRVKQVVHRIGHLFDMDCGVSNEHRPGYARCKTCGAEVSTRPREWRTK